MSSTFWKYGPAVFCVLVLTIYGLLFHYRAPFSDHWDLIPLYREMKAGDLELGDLFGLHGNHWHASGYAVQLGLSDVTDMAHWAECLASILIAVIGFIALMRLLMVSMDLLAISQATAWVFGVSALFFFSLDQSANWLWGWQVAVFINLAGALWTIERLSLPAISVRNTGLAAIACALAIYAFGTGWALIPIGFALLILRGALSTQPGRVSLLIWSVLTGLLLWHFFLALNEATSQYGLGSLPDFSVGQSWIGVFEYTANFLASPVVRFARDSALVATLLGSGILCWAVFKLLTVDRQYAWTAALPFLALAAYSVGAGLLTALGRWEAFGTHQAFVSRYISFGTFFWIAVFALAIFAVAKTSHRTHKRTFAVLGLLLVLKIANQPSVIGKSITLSNEVADSARQLAAVYPNITPEMHEGLLIPAQQAEAHLQTLYEHRVSLFANIPEPASEGSPQERAP